MTAGFAILFDCVLAGGLVWLSWRALTSRSLFRSIVLFIAYGLFLALAWVRLDAPDLAMAEAAIGAGITGVLLLEALFALSRNQGNAGQDGGRHD